MPYYYGINPGNTTSNASANVELDHLRLLTIANQKPAKIMALYGAGQSATAGGVRLRLASFATPSTVGSAFTPVDRNPDNPTAQLTAFTAPTIGTTRSTHLSVGFPQIGGTGGWFAIESDAGITLLANGGATGNADVIGIAQSASQVFDYTLEFTE
jgi:hypothetical protein